MPATTTEPAGRRRTGLAALLTVFFLGATAGPAVAAPLGPGSWRALYAETGTLTFAPVVGHHYATEWDRLSVATDVLVFDPVQRQPHWQGLYPDDLPALHYGFGLSSWWGPAPRWRIGGHTRFISPLAAWAGGVDGLFQILMGTTEASSFHVGWGLGALERPRRYRMLAPRLFLEWSTELFRGTRERESPWLIYLIARLDQGYRFVWGLAPDAPDDRDLMPTLIRGGLQLRHGSLRFGYDFGLQQGNVYSHGLQVQWMHGTPLRSSPPSRFDPPATGSPERFSPESP